MAINNSYDTIPGFAPIAVYSLRKRISSYIGAAIRIRDGFDNTEQDVGFDASGWVTPFVTVGTPYVTIFYDQQGVENLVNPTAASQPIFLQTGSFIGRPILDFSDGTRFLKTTDFTPPSANQFDVARPGGFASYKIIKNYLSVFGSNISQMAVGIPDDLVGATSFEPGFGSNGFKRLSYSNNVGHAWGPTIVPYTTLNVLADMQTSITDIQLYDDAGSLTTFSAVDVTYGGITTALYMGRMGGVGDKRSYSRISEYVFYDQAITPSQRTDIFDTLNDSFKTTSTLDYQHIDVVKATMLSGGIGGSFPITKSTMLSGGTGGSFPITKSTMLSGGTGGSFPAVKATALTYFPDIQPEISINYAYDPIDERIFLPIPNFDGANTDGWSVTGGFTTQLELTSGYGEADTGTRFFRGGASASSTASTTILFDAYTISGISAGQSIFDLSWKQRSWAGNDLGSVSYEFFDSSGASISAPIPSVPSNRWRIFINEVGSNGDAAIAEIEMRAVPGGANLCVGGIAVASSEFNGSTLAANGFDNNTATLWGSAAGDTVAGGAWIEYQFLAPVTIMQIAVTARSGAYADQAPRTFSLQYFDGTSWITVMSRLGESTWSSSEQRIFDGVGATISPAVAASSTQWDAFQVRNVAVPASADRIVIKLIATRVSGGDNDSFFDSIRGTVSIPKTPVPTSTILGNSNYRSLKSVSPVNAWSMIKRNDLYSGPALRIEDGANPGTFVDINFDASGKVSGVLPYVDSRCTILYDQYGRDDFKASAGANIQVVNLGGTKTTWGLRPTGTGMWLTRQTSTIGYAPVWQLPHLAWSLAIERDANTTALQNIFGVTNGSLLEYGLWLEARDLHWRVNSSGPADWGATDWFTDAATVQNVVSRCVSDMTSGSNAIAYFNNVQVGSRNGTLPIGYPNNRSMGLFDHQGIGNPWQLGDFYELVIYSPNSAMSVIDRTFIDTAMQEFG